MTVSVVTSEKRHQLAERMDRLQVREADIRETFILGAGPGGQKVNKTAICVRLHHAPSGIDIKCSRTRQREMNRFLARRLLCDRLEARRTDIVSARQQAQEKIRRQKRRRSRRQKARMLEEKHQQSEKKQRRRPIRLETP